MFGAIALTALKYGVPFLKSAGEKLGLSKQHSELAVKVASLVAGSNGDPEKLTGSLSQMQPADQIALQTLFNTLEERRMQHAETMESEETERIKSANAVWKNDVNQEDKFTKRSRPAGLYMFYLVIVNALLVVPIISVVKTGTAQTLDLPHDFWVIFGVAFTGYSALRSVYDKAGKNRPEPMKAIFKMMGKN